MQKLLTEQKNFYTALTKSLLTLTLLFLGLQGAMAQSVASWSFTGEPGNQLATSGSGIENVLALDFTRGAALTPVSGAGSINSSGWPGAGDRFYTFGFVVGQGFKANLTSLSISSRSSGTGPGQLALQYNGDGFAANLATWNQVGTADNIQVIDLSALANLTDTVIFRIVAVGTTSASGGTLSSGGTFRVFNHSSGSVSFAGEVVEESTGSPALALWDFTGQPGNQVATSGTGANNVAALDFTRGSGVTPTAAANSISGSGWSTDANDYFSFGFNVTPGFQVALQDLVIATRSSGTGPRDIALRYSVDGFTNNLATWIQTGTDFNNQIIDLSALTGLTGNVEFRIVVTSNVSANNGTIGSGGTFRVNNFFESGTFTPVQFRGTVSELPAPDPEPLVNWNFAGEPGNQAFTAGTNLVTGVLPVNFARGEGINPASAANSISSNGWNAGDDRFFTFGFQVAPGKLVDLTALQIGTRSSGTGPRDMALRYSGDGFSTNLATWTSQDAFLNQTIDLSGLTNLSGHVEFRIVSLSDVSANGGTVASGGTFRVTNFFPANLGTRFIGIMKEADGVVVPSLSVNPESLDFGTVNLGTSPVLTYQLAAQNLTSNVNISANAPFSVSIDGVTFLQTLSLSLTELAAPVTVSVKVDGTNIGTFAANVVNQTTGAFATNVPVTATVFDPFSIVEDFNAACAVGLPAGWSAISLIGAQVWACSNFGRAGTTPTANAPFGLQINGFSGGPQLNEDWLITPAYDLTAFDFPLLSFWSRVAFSGPRLRLLVSTNYVSGDPTAEGVIWTELADRFANADVWTNSGEINLSAFKTSGVRIAFVYNSSPETNAARWTLDDFSLRNSEVAPAPFLSNNIGNVDYFHFGVVPVGNPSATVRSFNFSLSDAVVPLTLSSVEGFEFSKDGNTYATTLTYTEQEAGATNTVFVRFRPLTEGAAASPVVFTSGDLVVRRGYLSGATLERSNTFDVVTWNIEWFGSRTNGPSNVDLQLQNVKTILEDLDADVYAFQEITGLDKFFELAEALPAYEALVSPAVSGGGTFDEAQKVTFLYKTSTVTSLNTRVLLEGVTNLPGYPSTPDRFWASGRLPFMLDVETNIQGVKRKLSLVNIHARSNGGGESAANPRYAMRRYDVEVLKDTLDTFFPNTPLVILGDYNDDLDETVADSSAPTVGTTESSFISYVNDTLNYVPITLNLSNAGLRTFIAFENVIDHVVVSNELKEDWVVNSERVVVPFNLVTNYQNTTSDHLPVKVRFALQPTVFTLGNCEFLTEDFPGAAEIIDVKPVTYADFRRPNTSFVVGLATGIRTDGRAGAWEIHNDCSIQPLRRSGLVNRTTLLPNVRGVEFERGWRYVPTQISEDGKEIFAVAINDLGFTHPRGWRVEPGTQVNIKFTMGTVPFYGRIFGVSGAILCDNLVVETFASNFFVIRCDDETTTANLRVASDLGGVNPASITSLNVKAYPNPVEGAFMVTVESPVEDMARFEVFDIVGRLVYSRQEKIASGATQVPFDAATWQTDAAVLIMRVQTAKSGNYQIKLVKP
jgi:endonuclease/exonuclease/phosphatase family metal-dependent hydrolase